MDCTKLNNNTTQTVNYVQNKPGTKTLFVTLKQTTITNYNSIL